MSMDKIYGLEKMSLVDYDGHLCATIFLASCNFRCPFCHNASLVKDAESLASFDEEEVFAYLNARKKMLDAVCITGGEPTLNPSLEKIIDRIKEMGYLVKLDSNGTRPEVLKNLIEKKKVDYIAMDIKSSPKGYPLATGVPFDERVLKSVELLLENKVDYEFRTTLVKGLITREDVEYMSKWLKGAKKFVFQSFVDREGCLEHGLEKVDKTKAEEYVQIMLSQGIPAKLRNYD